jgi:hypothetical protein
MKLRHAIAEYFSQRAIVNAQLTPATSRAEREAALAKVAELPG